MKDFNPHGLKLSKPAQKAIQNIDDTLIVYRDRERYPESLHLFPGHWDQLEKALQDASNKGISLRTRTYRGVLLKRMGDRSNR